MAPRLVDGFRRRIAVAHVHLGTFLDVHDNGKREPVAVGPSEVARQPGHERANDLCCRNNPVMVV